MPQNFDLMNKKSKKLVEKVIQVHLNVQKKKQDELGDMVLTLSTLFSLAQLLEVSQAACTTHILNQRGHLGL